jgi:hypothetical protein
MKSFLNWYFIVDYSMDQERFFFFKRVAPKTSMGAAINPTDPHGSELVPPWGGVAMGCSICAP